MFIPIPDTDFSYLDPGSRIKRIPDPGSRIKKIPDPGSRVEKIPNP
jgi:hypothetical protein